MIRVVWRPMALEDREVILEHIAQDNPIAAIEIDDAIEAKAEQASASRCAAVAGRRLIFGVDLVHLALDAGKRFPQWSAPTYTKNARTQKSTTA